MQDFKVFGLKWVDGFSMLYLVWIFCLKVNSSFSTIWILLQTGVLESISCFETPICTGDYSKSVVRHPCLNSFVLFVQDALPTFPDKVAFECIENELGVPLESIYSSISASPIAAASLGQVYKAVLRTTGEDVAVKVQRPGIEEAVGLDFYLVRGLTLLVDRYVDIITSNVTDLLDEFARRVYQELNYVQVCYCCYPIFCY
jgi:hypothetical protein